MNRIPTSPPAIQPVTTAVRPLWSVMIPVYNNIEYLEDAMTSVLSQNIPEDDMQIEVVDDASTDGDVQALVQQRGKGRIKYFRQVSNVGSLRNFETCINRSYGELVHLLHADDRVRNGYYHEMETLLNDFPQAGAAFCRFCYIDEKGKEIYNQSAENTVYGILDNWLIQIAERQRIQYVSITVRREVYEKLGAFYGLTYGEDWVMWARIAKHYPTAYSQKILADYRKLSMSISGGKFLTGEYLDDLVKAMYLIQDLLPEKEKHGVLKRSKKKYAHYALKMAHQLWYTTRDKKIVRQNINKGWQLYRDLPMLFKTIKIHTKMFLNWR